MDTIWARKSFEVGGHWPCRTDKSRTLKKKKSILQLGLYQT